MEWGSNYNRHLGTQIGDVKMYLKHQVIAGASILSVVVLAQQVGNNTPEIHPKLPTAICSSAGCVAQNTSIVLDSTFRWLHATNGTTNCIINGFNRSICPDPEACGKACSLEGIKDYRDYGLETNGDQVKMNLFTKTRDTVKKASARIYLYNEDEGGYQYFKLLNQEIAFDVDMSKAGCGVNGAFYLIEMSQTGDKDEVNSAGAKYGTGYCDAQCPKLNFINGRVIITLEMLIALYTDLLNIRQI
jgi:cellulose 1,4-beta-cellobiosidase